jgi:hypothetical protein
MDKPDEQVKGNLRFPIFGKDLLVFVNLMITVFNPNHQLHIVFHEKFNLKDTT